MRGVEMTDVFNDQKKQTKQKKNPPVISPVDCAAPEAAQSVATVTASAALTRLGGAFS